LQQMVKTKVTVSVTGMEIPLKMTSSYRWKKLLEQ